MGLFAPEQFDDIFLHIALAGINDDSVENIDIHRHQRSSHRAIAKLECLYFTELLAVYDMHRTKDDRGQKTDNREQTTENRDQMTDHRCQLAEKNDRILISENK